MIAIRSKDTNNFIKQAFPNQKTTLILFKAFIISILFEFIIAMPIYNFVSKEIGVYIFLAILAVFCVINLYFIVGLIRYCLTKKK
jgi:small basic protein